MSPAEQSSTPAPAGSVARVVTFRVRAETSFGDSIAMVGSSETFGSWDPHAGLVLTTTAEAYPLWTSGPVECACPVTGSPLEYKYIKTHSGPGSEVEWEANGANRKLSFELASSRYAFASPKSSKTAGKVVAERCSFVVDDGQFGYLQPETFGFPEDAEFQVRKPEPIPPPIGTGSLLVIMGDAVTAGHAAWCFDGWAQQLAGMVRERYSYQCVNLAAVKGAENPKAALEMFKEKVAPMRPTVVFLSFGLELTKMTEPHADYSWLATDFTSSMEELVTCCLSHGAVPIVGGPYPHAAAENPEHARWLKVVESDLEQHGVPVISWLEELSTDSGNGLTWADGISHDAANPNTEGHRRMLASVPVKAIFEPLSKRLAASAAVSRILAAKSAEQVCFEDENGFEITYSLDRQEITINNKSRTMYELSGAWQACHRALEAQRRTRPVAAPRRGVYILPPAETIRPQSTVQCIHINDEGRLEATGEVPPKTCLIFRAAHLVLTSKAAAMKVLFYDGNIGLVSEMGGLRLVNRTASEYNVHPMWREIRLATKDLERGIYQEDSSGVPFRTAVVTAHGLQSRVKVPPKTAFFLKYTGAPGTLKSVAVLPLGDRCSARMLLHKIEYDGPCYPFDLTRTTSLADVADIIASGFTEMWDPNQLCYSHDMGRIYHKKWTGLSFAHEVEDGDDPIMNFAPIAARMAKRYAGRAARFDYACNHADRVLFVRTGYATRGEVTDVLQRIGSRYPGLDASLLLISDQPTEEFQGLLGVTHVREQYDPDRMYEDMNYWLNCAGQFRGILNRIKVDERSLYWCPSDLKEAAKELKEEQETLAAKAKAKTLPTPPAKKTDETPKRSVQQVCMAQCFSHSNLYELEVGTTAAIEGTPVAGA